MIRDRLDALTHHLAGMCQAASDAMEMATAALLQGDPALADTVVGRRESFSVLTVEAERSASRLLAFKAPRGSDLRAIAGTVKNTADAQRMAVLAVNVATIARRCHTPLPAEVAQNFSAMGNLAVGLGQGVRDVVLTRDPMTVARIRRDDEAMDALHRRLQSLMTACADHQDASAAVDITLLGQFYERFANHGVHIVWRVIHQEAGH